MHCSHHSAETCEVFQVSPQSFVASWWVERQPQASTCPQVHAHFVGEIVGHESFGFEVVAFRSTESPCYTPFPFVSRSVWASRPKEEGPERRAATRAIVETAQARVNVCGW